MPETAYQRQDYKIIREDSDKEKIFAICVANKEYPEHIKNSKIAKRKGQTTQMRNEQINGRAQIYPANIYLESCLPLLIIRNNIK